MFDKLIGTLTYNVSFDLSTLEEHLDPNFLEVLLNELHCKSLTEAHCHVDLVSDRLFFSVIKEIK